MSTFLHPYETLPEQQQELLLQVIDMGKIRWDEVPLKVLDAVYHKELVFCVGPYIMLTNEGRHAVALLRPN